MSDDRLRALEVGLATLSATLTTKLDTLITQNIQSINDHETRLRAVETRPAPDPELDGRVDVLEKKVWTAAGWVAGVGMALNVALTLVLTLVV